MSNVRVGLQIALEGDKQAQQGLQRVKDGLDGLDTSAGKTAASLSRMNTSVGDIAKGVLGAQMLASSLQAVSNAATALPQSAFDYTKTLEASSVGMAGILGSMAAMNSKQLEYNQSLAISQDMIRKLGDDALRTAASSQELTTTFQALLAPGLAAKMTLDEIRLLTVTGVNAVKSIGLSGAQVVQELRDLVAGGITASGSQLATALGLKDADIAKAKASSEGLFAFLMERLKGFEESSSRFGETLQGRMDALKEGSTRVAAEGMKPLTDEISNTIGELGKLFVTFEKTGEAKLNPEIIASLRGVSEGLVSVMDAGKSTASVLYENREAVGGLVVAYAAIKFSTIAGEMAQAMQAKIALAQASRLAAVQSAVENAANETAVLTSRQKTAAILAELQANVQRTAAQVAATAGFGAATQAERAHALAVNQLTAAQNAASMSSQTMGAVMGALGGPVGIAVTALASLVGYMMSANAEAEKLAKVGQSKDRVDAANASGSKPEDRDISRLQAQLSQLKETRDELLLDQKDGGIMRFVFGNDYDVGLDAKLRQNQASIESLEKSLNAAKVATDATTGSTGTLTLTLSGAEQAWRKSTDGIKTASSIQTEYQDKLSGSQRAFTTYLEQLKQGGASEVAINKARVEQGQAEAALLKQRDEALKSLTKTQGASTTALENERISLLAKLKAEQAYAAALATRGLQADKMTEAEKSAERYALQAAKAKDARTAAIYKGLEALAREITIQEHANAVTSDGLKAHQLSVDAMVNDTKSINDRASAIEAENAVYGKSRAAIEAARLAAEEQRREDIAFAADPAYLQAMDDRIGAMRRYVGALKDADYKQVNAHTDEIHRAAQEQAKLYGDEMKLVGLTALERAKIAAQRQVEIKYAKELAAIDASNLSDTQKEAQRLKLLEDQQIESSAAVNKVVQEDWAKTSDQINSSLTDALMRGFERGETALENLGKTAVNMFSTMVLRPTFSAALTPVAGAVASTFGLASAGGGNGIGLGDVASGISLAKNAGTAWLTDFGGAVTNGLNKLGGSLFDMGFEEFGGSLVDWTNVAGDSIKQFAGIAGDAIGYINAFMSMKNGQYGAATGAALGTYFGGPIGSFIGKTIGGFVDEIFSGGAGTPHAGGVVKYSAGGGIKTGTDGGGEFGTTFGGVDYNKSGTEFAAGIAVGLTTMLDDIAQMFGKKAGHEVITAFADDSSSDGAWGALKISIGEKVALNWDDTRNNRWAPKEFADGQKGMEQYQAAIAKDVRDYLITQTPQWAASIFKGIGDTPTLQELSKAATSVANLNKALEIVAGNAMPALASASAQTVTQLVQSAAGADRLTAALGTYYETVSTTLDIQQRGYAQLSDSFTKIGVQLPQATTSLTDWYNSLVKTASATDLTSQANADHLVGLLQLAPAVQNAAQTWELLQNSMLQLDGLNSMIGHAVQGDKVASDIVRTAGGIDTFVQKVSAYQSAFYTEAEKNAAATKRLAGDFAAAGLQMPKTSAEFKSMMNAALTAGEAGKKTVGVLLETADAFAAVVPPTRDFIGDFLRSVPDTLTQTITGIMMGKEDALKAGTELGKSVADGITESILMGGATQISQAFMANIIEPIVTNVAAGRAMLDGVDLAGGIATAKDQIQALRDTLADPQIAGAIREIGGAVSKLAGAARGGVGIGTTSGLFAIGGSAINYRENYSSQFQKIADLNNEAALLNHEALSAATQRTVTTLQGLAKIDKDAADKLQDFGLDSYRATIAAYEKERDRINQLPADLTTDVEKLATHLGTTAQALESNGGVWQNYIYNQAHGLNQLAENARDAIAIVAQTEAAVKDWVFAQKRALASNEVVGLAEEMRQASAKTAELKRTGGLEDPITKLKESLGQKLQGINDGIGKAIAEKITALQSQRNPELEQSLSELQSKKDWWTGEGRLQAIASTKNGIADFGQSIAQLSGQASTAYLSDASTEDIIASINQSLEGVVYISHLMGESASYLAEIENPATAIAQYDEKIAQVQAALAKVTDPAQQKALLAELDDYKKGITDWYTAQAELLATEKLVDINQQIAQLAKVDAGPLQTIKAGIQKYIDELKALDQLTPAAQAQIDKLSGLQLGQARSGLENQLLSKSALDARALTELAANFSALGQKLPETAAGFQGLLASVGDQALRDKLLELIPAFVALRPPVDDIAAALGVTAQTVQAAYDRIKAASRSAEEVAQERIGLEERLFTATATTAEAAARARQAIDPLNRALYDTVLAAEEAKAAAEALAQTQKEATAERLQADIRLAQALGNTALAEQLQRDGFIAGLADLSAAQQAAKIGAYDYVRAIDAQITALQEANRSVDAALSAVGRAVDAQKKSIQSASQAQIDALRSGIDANKEALQAAQERVGSLTKLFDDVASAVKKLRADVEPERQMLDARAYIDMSLSLARAGTLPDQDRLAEAISVVTSDQIDMYTSQQDFAFAQKVQAGKLEELDTLASAQKSVAQLQLDSLEAINKSTEDQIKAIERTAKEQIAALDKQLEAARAQVDAIKGVDTSVLSVKTTIDSLQGAVGQWLAAMGRSGSAVAIGGGSASSASVGGGAGSVSTVVNVPSATNESSNSYYGNTTGYMGSDVGLPISRDLLNYASNTDSGGIVNLYQAAQSMGLTAADIASAYQQIGYTGTTAQSINDWAANYGIPAFDVGANVISQDMLAVVHKGEQIIPAPWNPATSGLFARQGGQSSARLEALVEVLIDRVQQLQSRLDSIDGHSARTADGATETSRTLNRVSDYGNAVVIRQLSSATA